MNNTPLIEPFVLEFRNGNSDYRARVQYAKSQNSCRNIFEVELFEPAGIKQFCLLEKPLKHEGEEYMIWTDELGRHSELYQLIGEEIARHMREDLGIVLIDFAENNDEMKADS